MQDMREPIKAIYRGVIEDIMEQSYLKVPSEKYKKENHTSALTGLLPAATDTVGAKAFKPFR